MKNSVGAMYCLSKKSFYSNLPYKMSQDFLNHFISVTYYIKASQILTNINLKYIKINVNKFICIYISLKRFTLSTLFNILIL